MMASSSPPRLQGGCVVSKHMLSRNRWSMPYCFALRMMPGTMSLPFSEASACPYYLRTTCPSGSLYGVAH